MTPHLTRGGMVSALSICALVACDSDFAPYNEVDGFRLLAITADPPELRPGATVTLNALVVGDDAPSFAWTWCPVTRGASEEHRCALDVDALAGLPSGHVSTASVAALVWPDDVDALCEASARAEAPPAAPRLDCDAERPTIQIRLELVASTGERIIALQSLPLADASAPPNHNPRIDAVRYAEGDVMQPLVDDVALAPGAAIDLELAIDPGAAEALPTGGREILRATWFVSGGETEVERTTFIANDPAASFERLLTNAWTLPTTGDVALYLVLRDDRGGTSWLVRRARLEGAHP